MRPPRLLPGLIAVLLLASVNARAAETPLGPVQAAYLRAETRKADDRFIAQVAHLTDSPEALVRQAMPPEGRITDPALRVMAAIEAQRKIRLSDEVRAQIVAAEGERRAAIAAARDKARHP